MTFLPTRLRVLEDRNKSYGAATMRSGETCQWIEGAVGGDDTCKCGKPVIGARPGRAPYCPEHARRAYESAAAWKRRNSWLGGLDGGFAQISLKDWMGEGE